MTTATPHAPPENQTNQTPHLAGPALPADLRAGLPAAGAQGAELIREGSNFEIDIERDVYLRGDLFRVKFPHAPGGKRPRGHDHHDGRRRQSPEVQLHGLRNEVRACRGRRVAGAGRKDRARTGRAARREPAAGTAQREELIEHALAERQERARCEKFRITSSDDGKPWADYTVASALSGKTYRVALRGEERGQSFCSCPDFRTNTLGTCKHVLHLLDRVRRRFTAAQRRKPYRNRETLVHVLYGEEMTLAPAAARQGRCGDWPASPASWSIGPIEDVRKLVEFVGKMERLGRSVTVYPDAEELIQRRLFQQRMAQQMAEIRATPRSTPCGRNC